MVEGDYVLSANNCQADEIPAALSLWWKVGSSSQGRALRESGQNLEVERKAVVFRSRIFSLSFQKHKGGGKHMGCGFIEASIHILAPPGTSLSPIFFIYKNWEE